MPAKTLTVSVGNITTGQYVQIDPNVKGQASVTFVNASGVAIRFAGELDAQPAVGYATYAVFASNSSAVISFDCNPSKTWICCESGGAGQPFLIDW